VILALIMAIPVAKPAEYLHRGELVYFNVDTKVPEPALRKAPVPRPERVETPPPEVKVEPPPAPVVQPVPEFKPPEVRPEAPHLVRVVQPVHFSPVEAPAAAARPARTVETNVFGGSSAPATVKLPAREVQTGGFGDPNGLPGQARGASHGNVAKLGSFDLPQGTGYGNGTGGSHGARGIVASAGFGNGIATQAPGSPTGTVKTAGFDQVAAGPAAPRVRQEEAAPAVVPVEILYKPRPQYTEEARQLKLEGEVLLNVVFAADGTVRINNVIRGLGHGLDEAAVRAAQQIRFKPATSGGTPVDFPATVHIEFELAY
jgi:TonB family protein